MSGQYRAKHVHSTVKTVEAGGQRPSSQIQIVLRGAEPSAVLAQPIPAHNDAQPAKQSKAAIKPLPGIDEYAEIERELAPMIGMEDVKKFIYEMYAMLYVGRIRTELGLTEPKQSYHMIFKGNPGTGKTTVARIVASLFKKMGVLSKGHLIEVERADLVGEYIGHTAQKTRDFVKKALGGVLFVDEAYSLARGGEKDFGKEAIDTLVKNMEDQRNQFILILAGYPAEIEDFLQTNPGLPSRFPIQISFPDYSIEQLVQIAELMSSDRDYHLPPQTVSRLRSLLQQEKEQDQYAFSNARYVRNVIEKAMRHQAVRLLSMYSNGVPPKSELMALRPEDLKGSTKTGAESAWHQL